MSTSPDIQLENLTLSYRRHPAVHHLSGRFAPGSLTAVVGPNGAGKSTLLKGLMGALRVDDGRIRLSGIARRDIAYLPQQSELDRNFPMQVLDLVSLGLWGRLGAFRRVAGRDLERALAALAAVGLEGFETRAIGTLSGGNQQKVVLARWLAMNPRFLILDEPTRGIDVGAHAEILRLIREVTRGGMSILVISSELEELVAAADRIIVVRDRRHVAELTGAEIATDRIMRAIADDGAQGGTEEAA